MKKILLLIPLLLLGSCAKDPGGKLEPPDNDSYSVTINPTSSGLTTTDSTENVSVSLPSDKDSSITYSVEFGKPCYINSDHPEIMVKLDGYIKSLSTYIVDRLIIDFFGTKGTIFDVFANDSGTGTPVEYHSSSVTSIDPNGGGMVYEYPINSSGWLIKRTSGLVDKQKPGFYSITVIFKV